MSDQCRVFERLIKNHRRLARRQSQCRLDFRVITTVGSQALGLQDADHHGPACDHAHGTGQCRFGGQDFQETLQPRQFPAQPLGGGWRGFRAVLDSDQDLLGEIIEIPGRRAFVTFECEQPA